MSEEEVEPVVIKLEESEEGFFCYLLDKRGEDREVTIHNTIKTGIEKVKEYLESDIPPEDINLMKIRIEEVELKVDRIPWCEIALELVKMGKKK